MKKMAVACLLGAYLAAGCFGPSPQIRGEKISPGECVQPNVIDIAIKAFTESPNASLSVKVTNIYKSRIVNFGWLNIVGSDDAGHDFFWIGNATRNWLDPNESQVMTWVLQSVPSAPWHEFSVGYFYPIGAHQYRTNLICNLEGDNLPSRVLRGA